MTKFNLLRMNRREISVIVTTYNRTNRLEQNIQSLLNQELDEDVEMEIIIVDDCSLKENIEMALQIANKSDRINLIVNSNNKGLSGSRNVGSKRAKGEFLLFLDDDIMVEPNYVMGHLSLLSANKGVATVGSLRFPPEFTWNNNLMKYLSSRELRQRNFNDFFLMDLPPQYLGGGICGMRNEDFIKAGGFNESFTFYGGEDVEMGNSLRKIGVRIQYAPLAKADHYDSVNIDRYRVKFTEAGREGVKLILKSDIHFFDNSPIRFFLTPSKKESFKDELMRFFISLLLNKYSEFILRMIAKLTNRFGFLYSKKLYHILFACWMYIGLKDSRLIEKSEVQYNNL